MNVFFAQISNSEPVGTVFRWSRLQENRDLILPVLIALLLVVYFVRRYRIDAVELRAWQRWFLMSLRLGVILGLFFYYLHPQWEHLVGSSRVAVLIDTSASMGNRDLLADSKENRSSPVENEDGFEHDFGESGAGPTRLEGVVDWIERSELVARLLEKHDVAIYSFDTNLSRLTVEQRNGLETLSSSPEKTEPVETETPETPEASETLADDTETNERLRTLKPGGDQTGLGDAIFDVLQRERGHPLAGIVLLSDGRNNAGRDPETTLDIAERLRIPVFTIGVGPTRQPLNFRVGAIDVPDRVFPDDPFTIKVPIEFLDGDGTETGLARTIPVQLWSRREVGPEIGNDAAETLIGEKELRFEKSGIVETEFEVRVSEPGKRRLTVKILPPDEDHHADDDSQLAEVEVVDRKDRVLLFASGPTRDYQFLCSQIHRDKSMEVDVFLPWAQPDISQNADNILTSFPVDRSEMARYDVLVAYDVNWRDLSDEQISVLEHWVARQGGGLVLVAGPIHQADTVTGWVTDMGMGKIRALYPVDFLARQSAFDHRYHGDEQAWPLKFTRAGEEAEFLRPVDDPVEARILWSDFPGFYGFFALRGVKPTATLLVASGSPETLGRAETGALVVEQFYGAGRVLYLGSGEFWRLRRIDERTFEQIATRMIRHMAQGRLQRESDRGSLATDKRRYTLGSIAQLRITVNDARLNPITAPNYPIDVLSPSGTLRTVEATLDPNVPGTFMAYLPMVEEGAWTLQLSLPESDRPLSRTVQVRMSNLERENPSRNVPLLRRLASKSGGAYYASPTEALPTVNESSLYGNLDLFAATSDVGDTSPQPITELLRVRSQRAVLDSLAEEKTMRWFLIAIASLLLAEWTLRRLMKLA